MFCFFMVCFERVPVTDQTLLASEDSLEAFAVFAVFGGDAGAFVSRRKYLRSRPTRLKITQGATINFSTPPLNKTFQELCN